MNAKIAKQILEAAVVRTKEVAGDYLSLTLRQRLQHSDIRAGSFYKYANESELLNALLSANWEVAEGSLEDGKVILKGDLSGFVGVVEKSSVNESDIFLVNPKNIPDRDEMAVHVCDDSAFPESDVTWAIVSTFNPETKSVNPDEPFLLTFFPGVFTGSDDTVVGKGNYVKLVRA